MLQISRVLAYAGDQGRDGHRAGLRAARRGRSRRRAGQSPTSCRRRARSSSTAAAPRSSRRSTCRGLVALAEREGAVVAMAWAVGDTLVDGMPLLRVHGGGRPVAERRLRRLVRLGSERTFEQDPKYAIRILVDIAIKALSPAINDPTTAVQALDQVEDLLLRLGRVDLDGRARARRAGEPAPRLPGPEVGGLPGPRLRRDPVLRRELDPGHAAHAGAAAGPDGARPARAAARPAALPGAGRQRHPPDLRGRATTGRTRFEEDRQGLGLSRAAKDERGGQGRVTLVLAVLTVLALALSVPGSLREAWERGGFYVFSREFLRGPAAAPLRARAGSASSCSRPWPSRSASPRGGADSRAGRRALPPRRSCSGPRHRARLVRSACGDIANLVLAGILVDSVCQWLILGASYPGAALRRRPGADRRSLRGGARSRQPRDRGPGADVVPASSARRARRVPARRSAAIARAAGEPRRRGRGARRVVVRGEGRGRSRTGRTARPARAGGARSGSRGRSCRRAPGRLRPLELLLERVGGQAGVEGHRGLDERGTVARPTDHASRRGPPRGRGWRCERPRGSSPRSSAAGSSRPGCR